MIINRAIIKNFRISGIEIYSTQVLKVPDIGFVLGEEGGGEEEEEEKDWAIGRLGDWAIGRFGDWKTKVEFQGFHLTSL
jgi:hypothetical protein